MRFFPAGVFAFIIMTSPAFALDLDDTMQAWAGASSSDKDRLLRDLEHQNGGKASGANLRSCLDDTSKAPGHSDLAISEVAKACAEQAARDNI